VIRQFDVMNNFLAPKDFSRPYLINLQHHSLDHLSTRILAPLGTDHAVREASRLNPGLNVKGIIVYLMPYDLVTLAVRQLRDPIANLASESFRITAALDLVFTGV
jgi:toxin CcdB